jgi:hypothetical protein
MIGGGYQKTWGLRAGSPSLLPRPNPPPLPNPPNPEPATQANLHGPTAIMVHRRALREGLVYQHASVQLFSKMAVFIRNDSWREDLKLRDEWKKYVKQGIQRK